MTEAEQSILSCDLNAFKQQLDQARARIKELEGGEINQLKLRVAELEAAQSEAAILLQKVLPICWSEDWDADDVRNRLEWAIKFCGGKVEK